MHDRVCPECFVSLQGAQEGRIRGSADTVSSPPDPASLSPLFFRSFFYSILLHLAPSKQK